MSYIIKEFNINGSVATIYDNDQYERNSHKINMDIPMTTSKYMFDGTKVIASNDTYESVIIKCLPNIKSYQIMLYDSAGNTSNVTNITCYSDEPQLNSVPIKQINQTTNYWTYPIGIETKYLMITKRKNYNKMIIKTDCGYYDLLYPVYYSSSESSDNHYKIVSFRHDDYKSIMIPVLLGEEYIIVTYNVYNLIRPYFITDQYNNVLRYGPIDSYNASYQIYYVRIGTNEKYLYVSGYKNFYDYVVVKTKNSSAQYINSDFSQKLFDLKTELYQTQYNNKLLSTGSIIINDVVSNKYIFNGEHFTYGSGLIYKTFSILCTAGLTYTALATVPENYKINSIIFTDGPIIFESSENILSYVINNDTEFQLSLTAPRNSTYMHITCSQDVQEIQIIANKALFSETINIGSKNILCLGDSITEFQYNGMDYTKYISQKTGFKTINIAYGGTRMTSRVSNNTYTTITDSTQAYGALDCPNIIDSLISNDYTYIENAIEYLKENTSDDNTSIFERMLTVNMDNVDIITLFFGINDYTSGIEIGSNEDTQSDNTFKGQLKSIIQKLSQSFPHIKVYVCTPCIRYVSSVSENNFSDNYKNNKNYTLADYADAIKDICKIMHIQYIDLYYELGWNQYNFFNYFLENDFTHPYLGFEDIATKISKTILYN